jgi:HD superfamily phosphohydrolase
MHKSNNFKIIRDSIHGNIKIDGIFLELMVLPELQRLQWIKQLGFTHLVYPGANHTRLEHSLGTFYVAKKIAEALGLTTNESEVVSIAGLLHDIGHGPFSHTLEYLLYQRLNQDHKKLTQEIILGKIQLTDANDGPAIKEVLENHGIDPKEIVNIIQGKSDDNYLSQIINGTIDADQIDYLLRDAYYTGVAYGIIDIDRLLHTLIFHKNKLVIKRKGVSAIENMFVARALMYSSVYLHKTVRISELMLARAVERAPDFAFSHMIDSELMVKLKDFEGFQKDVILRLKYRKLFKKAYMKSPSELKNREKNRLIDIGKNVVKVEDDFAGLIGMDKGYIIIDVPMRELYLSEPRLEQNTIGVLNDKKIEDLSFFTPFPQALQTRSTTDWAVMVCTTDNATEKVSQESERYIFG